MSTQATRLRILVCGGGSGGHFLAILAASRPNVDVRVLTLSEQHARDWSNAITRSEMIAEIKSEKYNTAEIRSKPLQVTSDPSDVVGNADLIFIVLPAYMHSSVLNAIKPHIESNTVVVALPGRPGFEMQCFRILQETARQCIIASFETLPWTCRLSEYGKKVQVSGVKEVVGMFLWEGQGSRSSFQVLKTIQNAIGDQPKIKLIQNHLVLNLMDKSLIHPPIMYGKWNGWDGKPLKEKPLFYQGVDDYQAELLSRVSDEVLNLTNAVHYFSNEINVSPVLHLNDWMKEYYANQIEDDSSLKASMQTNKAYKGLTHPMQLVEGGLYVPDFTYRYLREDIPFGLVVLKGIAQIFEVATPTIDEVIIWGQRCLGKEYVVGSELKGKDLGETRAPQVLGIHSKQGLLDMEHFQRREVDTSY